MRSIAHINKKYASYVCVRIIENVSTKYLSTLVV